MTDFDSPWKEALDVYFERCLELLFPVQHAAIDWSRAYEFLDKEFQQLLPAEETSRLVVDKLVRVWLYSGQEEWLLIHLEIQCQAESGFAERMYGYNRRIADCYNRFVVSLAVLGDDRPAWRPQEHVAEQLGCSIQFRYPVAKLLDLAARREELDASDNPFAKVVLAHLAALATAHQPNDRRNLKFELIRSLYEQGFVAADVRQLFRFIDWVLELPADLERSLRAEFARYEEERKMPPYVTSFERLAREEGLEQGLQQGLEQGLQKGREEGLRQGVLDGIELGLQLKFGAEGASLMPEIRLVRQVSDLRSILAAIASAPSLADLRKQVASLAAGPAP